VTSYAGVVDKAAPAVVTIRVEKRAQPMPTGLDQGLGELFGPGFRIPQQPRGRERGLGSGVVVHADGYILTNNHVVEGADTVRVELPDRRVLDGKVVGTDPASDLAVVKVAAKGLAVLPLGDSDRVRVGDVVLALGNPLGVGQTVTMGIVSGKGRRTGAGDGSFEDFLQTDAAINQGNSGGALVNLNGELVGINSQILTPTGGNIGVGFAIPANMARNVMEQLIAGGRVHRSRLGVTAQSLTGDLAESLRLPSVEGALVSAVEPGSPAERAGLRQGDLILEVNGRPVADSNALRNEIASMKPGSTAAVTILRDGSRRTVNATLAELPASKQAEASEDGGSSHGRFGMTVQPVTPEIAAELDLPRATKGVVVTDLDPSGIAADSGFQEGDVIVRVGSTDVRSGADLRAALDAQGSRPALVLVNRHGTTLFFTLKANG
jgi:Do/DeqQ family serine protease